MNDKHPKCLEFIRLGKKGEDIYRSYHYGIDFPISKEMAIERFKYKSRKTSKQNYHLRRDERKIQYFVFFA